MKLGAVNYLTKPASTSRIVAAFDAQEPSFQLPEVLEERMSLVSIAKINDGKLIMKFDGEQAAPEGAAFALGLKEVA